MSTSRRHFFQSLGLATVAGLAFPRALSGAKLEATAADGFIHLNHNENAYGPSAKVTAAIRAAVEQSNRYAAAQAGGLVDFLASVHKVKPDQVLLGCGSTEILRAAACAFLGPSRQLVQAVPTYGAVGRYAQSMDADVKSIPLTPSFAHDLGGMLSAASKSTSLVYICNPNNPTASLTPRKDLETFIAKLPASTIVIVDEAYYHYADQSAMFSSFLDDPIDDPRLIVTRTMSKVYGLAGLRIGYAIAFGKANQQLRRFLMDNNVNAIAAAAAVAALEDQEAVNEFVLRNANDRQEFFNQAMARALKPIDSHANFAMMDTLHPTDEVAAYFRKGNILIGQAFPPMNTHIRVSLGRPEEMVEFWRVWDTLPYPKHTMHH